MYTTPDGILLISLTISTWKENIRLVKNICIISGNFGLGAVEEKKMIAI